MWKKVRPRQKAAFLKALGETGNITLAAEHAKLSRSWVVKWRGLDPEFDRACKAAVAAARDRLGAAEERRPGKKNWRYFDGAELVVRGSKGRRLQIARARLHQWTPRVERRFLEALLSTCNVKASLKEAGMSPSSGYAHRKRWQGFERLWQEAEAESFGKLDAALAENALNLFSEAELPLEAPLKEMTVAQAIQLVHMHKNGVLGIGGKPGTGWQPRPRLEDVKASILRTFSAVARRRGLL